MFTDESKCVLEDRDGEREFDFSLRETLMRAQTKPVFKVRPFGESEVLTFMNYVSYDEGATI